jgi:hypothetical protein
MTMSYPQQPGPHGQPYPAYPPPAPPTPKKSRSWPWIVAAVLAVFIGIGIVANDTNPASSPSGEPQADTAPATAAAKAPAKPAGPAGTMDVGVYQVGVDVQAGRYKTPGPPTDDPMDMCFWSRNSNDSGEFEAVIANGIVEGPGSVTVNRGEFVEITGACSWTKVG